ARGRSERGPWGRGSAKQTAAEWSSSAGRRGMRESGKFHRKEVRLAFDRAATEGTNTDACVWLHVTPLWRSAVSNAESHLLLAGSCIDHARFLSKFLYATAGSATRHRRRPLPRPAQRRFVFRRKAERKCDSCVCEQYCG